MTPAPAIKRKRAPSIAAEIKAIVKSGLCPRVVHHPDGRVEVTGLPPGKLESDQEGAELDREFDRALGAGHGGRD